MQRREGGYNSDTARNSNNRKSTIGAVIRVEVATIGDSVEVAIANGGIDIMADGSIGGC